MRIYKAEYIRYLFRAYASSMETIEHLEYLYQTNSLRDKRTFDELIAKYSELNKMLYSFTESVEREHSTDLLKK